MRKMPQWKPGRPGFTLAEMLVVLGIILVLATLATYALTGARRAGDVIVEKSNAAQALHKKREARSHALKPFSYIPDQFIVQFQEDIGDPANEVDMISRNIPLEVLYIYKGGSFRGAAIRTPATNVPALQKLSSVKYVQQDRVASILGQTIPTGIRRVYAPLDSRHTGSGLVVPIGMLNPAFPFQPRNIGTGGVKIGTDVVLAVMDTGIDSTHPDLNVENAVVFGFPDVTDQDGHGTHVSGIAGAKDNDIGVVGMSPGVRLWSVKVLGPTGTGTEADVLAGLNYVLNNAGTIRVCNMSLGVTPPDPIINALVTQCYQAGVIMVAAAGNSSADASQFSPASAPGVYCVAALSDSDGLPGGLGPPCSDGDKDDTFASYSNFGDIVTFIAPGTDILSTFPVSMGSYTKLTGTSMACPHVAGLAGLARDPDARRSQAIRNIRSKYNSPNPNFTPDFVKGLMLQAVIEQIPGPGRLYPLINAQPF